MSARRVGIIGTGFMGTVHAEAWQAIGEAPVAFLCRERGADLGDLGRFGAPLYTDLDDFFSAVDVVDICAPTHVHAELALAAARAGKPTLCEKPLSLSVAEGSAVLEAFERADVPLQVGHILRFSPEYRAAWETVSSGELGAPAVLRLSRLSFAPERGPGSWFADDAKSGGIFFDLMIHDLDYARWIAGDVSTVFAKSAAGGAGHGTAILRHESGALSHVEASWAQPRPVFRTLLEIAGSRGLISFSSDDTSPVAVRRHITASAASTGLGDIALAANPFEIEVRHFLDVVDGNARPALTALDALKAVQLAAATCESAQTGKPVCIRPLGGGS
ncbi:Gfo/Idh/MocA family oxidoreductase [Pseudonocardia acidicola]|uniref:Gfo/Idh/MocA family oxidoreductase n=1 Tax=Pseudonocardia acidicola TaxID=2724939 RepID=A0ABX1S781_9PSEU|nr:Gfo/Idh/MocA family oxidoreductase [Pseudonocardia acidicola]